MVSPERMTCLDQDKTDSPRGSVFVAMDRHSPHTPELLLFERWSAKKTPLLDPLLDVKGLKQICITSSWFQLNNIVP